MKVVRGVAWLKVEAGKVGHEDVATKPCTSTNQESGRLMLIKRHDSMYVSGCGCTNKFLVVESICVYVIQFL